MDSPVWPSEWLKGTLELCVLSVVARGTTYGYAITRDLSELGLGTIKGGTLYPLLSRLDDAGHLIVEWHASESGPARKYYTLSPSGAEYLAARKAQWDQFSRIIHATITES